MYVRVREKNIRSSTMKISTETGEDVPIYDDVIICRLNFCRRPFLDYAYIRNYELKFSPLTIWKYGSTNWILQGSFFPKEEMVSILRCSGDNPGNNMARV